MLVILCTLLAFITSGFITNAYQVKSYDLERADDLFEDFMRTHNKIYANEEEKLMRRQIFIDNVKEINEGNAKGGHSVYGINHFTDLRKEEFIRYYVGCIRPSYRDSCKQGSLNHTVRAPQSFNWVEKGAVTNIKDQKQCGSCWAFSAIGSIEAQHFLKTGQLVSLSEQELVDCSTSNDGCDGGFMTDAMTDLVDLGGVVPEDAYPYTAATGQCNLDKSKIVAKLQGCTKYKFTDEESIKDVLVSRGPISFVLYAADLQKYKGGVYSGDECATQEGLHGVLLVGYGTENGKDYWLFKNSWGTQFGENGFFKLARNENTCGFMNFDEHAIADM